MKLIIQFFLIFFLQLPSNCKSKPVETVSERKPEQLQRIWMLIEFQNFKKEELIKNQAQMSLKDLTNANANMGCNVINFRIEVKNQTIKFISRMRTEMFCENKMQLEDAFCKTLEGEYKYKIAGHRLFLTNSKNEKMTFVAQDFD